MDKIPDVVAGLPPALQAIFYVAVMLAAIFAARQGYRTAQKPPSSDGQSEDTKRLIEIASNLGRIAALLGDLVEAYKHDISEADIRRRVEKEREQWQGRQGSRDHEP